MINTEPTILAIETATSSCSVAVSSGANVYCRSKVGNNIHSKALLSMVDNVVKEASISVNEIQAVAVGQGPGSFTGLRIGIGVAQGLAFGLDCPMIGVSSLDALAKQSGVDGHVIAGIDARMNEIYLCEYLVSEGSINRISDLQVLKPEAVRAELRGSENVILVGNAWAEYWSQFNNSFLARAMHFSETVYPDAVSILQLSKAKFHSQQTILATEFAPEYVRNDVAKKSAAAIKNLK